MGIKGFIGQDFKAGTEALRDCPFCGGRPQFSDDAVILKLIFGMSLWNVWCPKCHASTFHDSRTKQEAIEKWNGTNNVTQQGT